MNKNISKNIHKNLNGKFSQNRLDHEKQSATDALENTSKKIIQKTEEVNGNLIGNKIADKVTKVSRNSSQNGSGRVANETENIGLDKEIPKERCISPEKRQKIDNVKDLDVVMLLHILIEYSDNYSKTHLWKYYGDKPDNTIANSESFKSEVKITGKTLLLVIQKMLK